MDFISIREKFRFSDSEIPLGLLEGKKNLSVYEGKKMFCVTVVLFLALKRRLLRVFRNMSVNNG